MGRFRARLQQLKQQLDTAVFRDAYDAVAQPLPLPSQCIVNEEGEHGDSEESSTCPAPSPLKRQSSSTGHVGACPLCDRPFQNETIDKTVLYLSDLFDDEYHAASSSVGLVACSPYVYGSWPGVVLHMLPDYAYMVL